MLPDVACAKSEAVSPVATAKMARFRKTFILSPPLSLLLRAKKLFLSCVRPGFGMLLSFLMKNINA
jgi:hypothetical protein